MRPLMIPTLITLFLTPVALLASPGPGGGTTPLSQAEIDGLLWMREEEKLARDVYQVFYDQYHVQIFANIKASEQQHTDAILTLLNRYGVTDPAAGNDPGEFTNPDLQALYDTLVAQGAASLQAAQQVGVTIEETDIADLDQRLASVTHRDIRQVYLNLKSASQNHLRAFTRQLGVASDNTTPRGFRVRNLLATAPSAQACSLGCGQQCRHRHGASDGRGPRLRCGMERNRPA